MEFLFSVYSVNIITIVITSIINFFFFASTQDRLGVLAENYH